MTVGGVVTSSDWHHESAPLDTNTNNIPQADSSLKPATTIFTMTKTLFTLYVIHYIILLIYISKRGALHGGFKGRLCPVET